MNITILARTVGVTYFGRSSRKAIIAQVDGKKFKLEVISLGYPLLYRGQCWPFAIGTDWYEYEGADYHAIIETILKEAAK